MLLQALMIAAGFACASVSNPAESSLPCSAPQAELERECANFHEAIVGRAQKLFSVMEYTVTDAKRLFEDMITILESTQEHYVRMEHTDRWAIYTYTDYMEMAAICRARISRRARRIAQVVSSADKIMSESYAICIEAHRYYESVKQYASTAGLACNYQYKVSVGTGVFDTMDMDGKMVVLSAFVDIFATEVARLTAECRYSQDGKVCAERSKSVEMHVDSLKSHEELLKSLLPLVASLSSTAKIPNTLNFVIKTPSLIAALSTSEVKRKKDFSDGIHPQLQLCLESLVAIHKEIDQGCAVWFADLASAMEKLKGHASSRTAEFSLDELVNQSLSSSVVGTDF
ncbi:hypothetical protein PAPHI01_0794 [Pancytospora philotis]|nr:hypothetical protein PAPHI01_0794 [Pancytospora philotis]